MQNRHCSSRETLVEDFADILGLRLAYNMLEIYYGDRMDVVDRWCTMRYYNDHRLIHISMDWLRSIYSFTPTRIHTAQNKYVVCTQYWTLSQRHSRSSGHSTREIRVTAAINALPQRAIDMLLARQFDVFQSVRGIDTLREGCIFTAVSAICLPLIHCTPYVYHHGLGITFNGFHHNSMNR